MKLAIGADHAGYHLKAKLVEHLRQGGHIVEDFGTHSADRADYADFAHPVSEAVERGDAELGILVCGSGNGVCITANRHKGIRAAMAWLPELAALSRQHNNANVLCLPARFISEEVALSITETFLASEFEGGRHAERIRKI